MNGWKNLISIETLWITPKNSESDVNYTQEMKRHYKITFTCWISKELGDGNIFMTDSSWVGRGEEMVLSRSFKLTLLSTTYPHYMMTVFNSKTHY